MVKKSRGE